MPTIVHIDVAAEDPERAKKFYESCFGWKFQPTTMNYYLFTTSGLKGEPGVAGGLGKRMDPGQKITAYIGVDSIDKAAAKIKKSGGKEIQGKMPVPGFGYVASYLDTEGNMFGLWEAAETAK
ncbi:MAG: glyoxalase [Chloroflexi bacterium RBG_16_56_11]|nr:MAG: glyoxalase [Chloroflexi bacterium RBG_16_56_11]